MKSFEYGDEEIGVKEILFSVPGMVIGVGILSLPRLLSTATNFLDGWISIIIGGIVAIFFTWIVAKLASRFPRQTFFTYASSIISTPVAFALTLMMSIDLLLFTAYEIRSIAVISKHYLFDRTPVEVISFTFLLVVVYAVSNSRVAILRLNVMFLPIIFFVALLVCVMNIKLFEISNLLPVFQSEWTGYLQGGKESFFSFAGFEILLFYIALMNQPKRAPKFAALGMSIPLFLYLVLHLTTIGVFSYQVTASLTYPTIELAKEVVIPGGFFERFESIFFTIWIMAIFITTTMAFDVTLIALSSLFKKIKKRTWIIMITPVIYLAAMLPQSYAELGKFGSFISYTGLTMSVVVPTCLLIMAKLRGVKSDG
ncbi:endospore germination permease [Alkalihalobacillus sp. AL-G]|uniref:GerAB/ArcD/ProY family transporter n=1 Tax=Alkalihalobacillus sp. AL-G TaxID=2926399 RepID=UPI00272C535F|nr:endospore germination permease [Alkalihalobacillus sp. AL-G]WLD92751.1 spore germination protein [Alkalihalobacillus sp. AL-G]